MRCAQALVQLTIKQANLLSRDTQKNQDTEKVNAQLGDQRLGQPSCDPHSNQAEEDDEMSFNTYLSRS